MGREHGAESLQVSDVPDDDEVLIRLYYECFNARRLSNAAALIAPQCEFNHVITRDHTQGRRGYEALVEQWLDTASDLTLIAESVTRVERGFYRVMLRLQGHRSGHFQIGRDMQLPADGRAFDFVGTHELRVRDGYIVSSRFVYDPRDLTEVT